MLREPEIDRFAEDTGLAQALLARINRLITELGAAAHATFHIPHSAFRIALMEVCGTHTMAISALGVRRAVDPRLKLLSGPGCPVCVTAQEDLDAAIELARRPAVTVATFGDMMRVPGSDTSLEQVAAHGGDVRIVYSPLDALKLAQENPNRSVVFLGVGFETTAPTVAAAVKIAAAQGVRNFLVVPLFKTMPEALRVIAAAPRIKVDGFLLPGHVSTVIGSRPYEFLAAEFHKPCCIVGFELLDLLQGVMMLLEQLGSSHSALRTPHSALPPARVEIQYKRSVTPEGNIEAQRLLAEVLQPCDAIWRGLGCIPGSGLEFRPEYKVFDARHLLAGKAGSAKSKIKNPKTKIMKGCRCGDVLLGAITPPECKLFAKVCTPENPLGPCMVSSEGACAAYYKYER